MFHQLSRACFISRRYAEGEAHALAAIREAPDLPLAYWVLVRHRVGLGEIEGARTVIAERLRLNPDSLERQLAQTYRGGFRGAEHRRRYDYFLRIAAGVEAPSVEEPSQ